MGDDARAAAAAAALAPYAWRGLTVRMLARCVVGAADRQAVLAFISSVPGTLVGDTGPVRPAEPEDERVHALVQVLESRDWRGASLRRLCSDLMAALDAWYSDHETFGTGLRRLLDDH